MSSPGVARFIGDETTLDAIEHELHPERHPNFHSHDYRESRSGELHDPTRLPNSIEVRTPKRSPARISHIPPTSIAQTAHPTQYTDEKSPFITRQDNEDAKNIDDIPISINGESSAHVSDNDDDYDEMSTTGAAQKIKLIYNSSDVSPIKQANDGEEPSKDDTALDEPPSWLPLPGLDDDGLPKLASIHYFAIVWNYFAVGVFYGAFPALIYPIFKGIFDLPSYYLLGAKQFITIWWSFKTFFACMSDSWPILGYRRKWYVFGGWLLAGILTCVGIYIGQPTKDSPSWLYIILFSSITLCYLIADVAMDGAVVDFAMREPIERRGKLQATIYMTRSIAMTITSSVIAFGFNSEEYGGHFDYGLQLPWLLIGMNVVNVIGLFFYWNFGDIPNQISTKYTTSMKSMFSRMQLNAVWKIIMFSFFMHLLVYVTNSASYDVQKQWCHVTPIIDGIFNQMLTAAVTALAIWITRKYFLSTSWHKMLIISVVTMATITYVVAIIVDFNIFRSQYFYVGGALGTNFLQGIFFIVCSFCAVEVAEKGNEGITFGLMTTVANLCYPIATLIAAVLASMFKIYEISPDGKYILIDTPSGHLEMFKLDTCVFIIQMCSLFSLFLLPKQKKQVQEQLKLGFKSKKMAWIITISLFVLLSWSLTGSLLQILPSTTCLRIVGGHGCK